MSPSHFEQRLGWLQDRLDGKDEVPWLESSITMGAAIDHRARGSAGAWEGG